ncbi:DUF4038 domain-containing protein [Phytoactinopolyspora limicola]|uniref:apiosidase-like domain-containing protein n=1 Tax=Phytoactinopolyspora limicola TaxID=2715536 RepID=UPI001FE508B7|nr:DUF4038 domain-containing protein [Phytoactinopolyspora limicola]
MKALTHPTGVVDVISEPKASGVLRHGPVRVADDGRHLEHEDGSPFLWLADTWWHGFTERISQREFGELAGTRAQQGFSVVQIVAGLYPETIPLGPEGRSTSGWVWEEDFSAPNVLWFDEADRRIRELLKHDLIPCIVGAWAYYVRVMGTTRLLRHWRELIARWGAYPVVWCLAGEPPSTWKLEHGDDNAADSLGRSIVPLLDLDEAAVAAQLAGLNEVARGVRELEPFGRPITIHSIPARQPWEFLEDDRLVDFWLLQTGHQGVRSLAPSVGALHEALAHEPTKPVINGESCYEGIAGSSWQETQRFLFWTHMLSGAAGHSYGAHGIWAFNTPDLPGLFSGLAPTWKDAAEFPGAAQLGVGRRLLLELPWHAFKPHPEWVEPHFSEKDLCLPYAAGVENGPRLFYFPGHGLIGDQLSLAQVRLRELGDRRWRGQIIDPRTGSPGPDLVIESDDDGTALLQSGYRGWAPLPSWEDWLLLLRPV